MRQNAAFITILAFIFIQISCKKSDPGERLTQQNQEERSEIQIPTSGNIIDMIDNGFFITLLMEEGGGAKIVRMNTKGELLWERSYNNIQGQPLQIIQLDNGNMAFTSTSVKLNREFQDLFGWFQENPRCDISTTELSDYAIRHDSIISNNIPTGGNNLVKIDVNGDILWNKSLDHGTSDIRMSYADLKIGMAIDYSSVRTSYYVDRRFGGQYPVITFDLYDGKIQFEDYDATSGNFRSNTEITSMELDGFKSPSYQYFQLASDPYFFEVSKESSNSLISYSQGFVVINGGVAQHIDGPYKICKNEFNYHHIKSANRDINGNIFLIGSYVENNAEVKYLAALNEDGSLKWEKQLTNVQYYPKIITPKTDNGFFLLRTDNDIEYYNENGVIQSSHTEGTSMEGEITLMNTNPNGVTFLHTSLSNEVKLVRLNLMNSGL